MRSRGAASSSASGSPSRRRQISTTAAAFSSVSANEGSADTARSTNSCTAGDAATAFMSGSSESGSASGSTDRTHSPVTPSGSRLVARTCTPGHDARRRATSRAASSTMCSQLSKTSSSALSRRNSMIESSTERCWRCCMSSTVATALDVDASSLTPASSTITTPSANSSCKSSAARNASVVFPTPPGPTRVTSASCGTSALSASISASRPTRWVVSRGTVLGEGRALRRGAFRSVGSSTNTRCSRSRSSADTSRPSSSRNSARTSLARRRASACRPVRWSASTSWRQNRSRNGFVTTSRSSSPTSCSSCPRSSRSSMSCSSAASRSSSSRTASARAQS